MKLESILDPDRKISPFVPLFISLVIIGVDLLTPPQIILSIFFVIPILIAAWYNGLRWALLLSVVLPSARLFIVIFIETSWHNNYDLVNTIDRVVVLSIVSLVTAKLSSSIKHVKILEGLIPICSRCKKIRNKNQEWQPLEKFITERSYAQFTHGLCPDCAKELYGDYIRKSKA